LTVDGAKQSSGRKRRSTSHEEDPILGLIGILNDVLIHEAYSEAGLEDWTAGSPPCSPERRNSAAARFIPTASNSAQVSTILLCIRRNFPRFIGTKSALGHLSRI
jgi:hypothetical protein